MRYLYSFLLMSSLFVFSIDSVSSQVWISGETQARIIGTDWSPDGQYIAYGVNRDIMLISADGGDPVNLTEDVDDICLYPKFSPDGTEVTYSRWPYHQDTILSGPPCSTSIEAINIHTGEIRVVIEDGYLASFSPDGRYAAYAKDMTRQYYGIYDLQTEDEHKYNLEILTTPLYDRAGRPSIYSDNTHFITTATTIKDFVIQTEYDSDTDNNQYKMYRISIDTGKAAIVDIGEYSYFDPMYSRDGTKLLCTQKDYNHFIIQRAYEFEKDFSIPEGIYLKDGDTGEYVPITIENYYDVDEPQELYYKDNTGEMLAWDGTVTKSYGIWDVTSEVVIYDLLSGEVTRILDPYSCDTMYGSWSPDGTKICYVRKETDASYLNIYDIEQNAHSIIHVEGESVPSAVHDQKPVLLSIKGIYPNPFNPSTTIEFSLSQTGNVHIVIYNMIGQKIRDLFNGTINRGLHSQMWNGRDNQGGTVSSGVYLCHLTMGEQVASRQMLLLR
nr:T9SS type A sorting domain-containing protein [uncultured Sulfurimonas sp.]